MDVATLVAGVDCGHHWRCSTFWSASGPLIPAYLQAKRGSHIVITTIMFNYIAFRASECICWSIVLRPAGAMEPATARFPGWRCSPAATLQDILRDCSAPSASKGTASQTCALFRGAGMACVIVWLLIWRTRFGYEIRAFGKSESAAAKYAGISPVRITVITMLISGALAGLMAINKVMGEARASGSERCRRRGLHRHRRGAYGPVAPGSASFWPRSFCSGFSIRAGRNWRFGPASRANSLS